MIKLNNKNITYIALADTNNSTIGVKEIWYADSSNSVKLVYRRKDALIEGEDYEKYHWLKGDGSAYMQISQTSKTDFNINLTYKLSNVYKQMLYGSFYSTSGGWKGNMLTWGETSGIANKILLRINTNNGNNYINLGAQNVDVVHTIKVVDGRCYFDDVDRGVCPGYSIYSYDKPFLLFNGYNVDTITESNASNAAISKFSIEGYCNLIPCKLLKPLPKWLDANGIRREIGECGMIDLISGKFYGNVNSVGTFTVENYYERKEWLVGDGEAYIDTDIIVDVPSLYISTSFTKKVGGQTPLFGSRNSVNSNGSHIWYMSNGKLRLDIVTNEGNWIYIESNDVQNINQLIVDCPNKVININEITVQSEVDDLSIKNSSNTFKIFSLEVLGKDANTGNTPYHGAFGNFALNDSTHSLNLIPCTLTMDLPASMDANNIARTKGTSGMWDLVSDKFYGNVASSGTFKAVNLTEGVDYEVHDKLIVEDGRFALPLNSEVFECTIENLSNNNNVVILQASSRYTYHYKSNEDNTSSALTCWDLTQNTDVVGKYHLNNPSTFISDGTTFKCNGSNVTKYGFPPDSIDIRSSHSFKISISAITVDGIERYIPVKLLKSIPSTYDANGIARQAGECGMYDTVNDVFYGNVASSGSFSCVNDS